MWWKLDWYFIDHFSSFWGAWCSELRGTSSYWICFDYWCCCYIKSINYSSVCSKIWSYLSNLAWSLVSNQSSEDEFSEVRLSTSFSMCYSENFFGSICCFPFNSIYFSSGCSKIWLYRKSLAWNFLSKLSSEDGC